MKNKSRYDLEHESDGLLEAYTDILNEAPPPGPPMEAPPTGAPMPMPGGPMGPPDGGENIPGDATTPEEEEKPLTPEGQVYLWEMIRQALAFNGQESLTPEEKSLFETAIDQDNFKEMRERIMAIFTRHIAGPVGLSLIHI